MENLLIETFPMGRTISLTELFFSILMSACVAKFVYYHWQRRRLYIMAGKIPGPTSYPIIGSAHLFTGSTESILNEVIKLHNNYSRPLAIWLGQKLFFGIASAEHFEIIFNHPRAIGKDELYRFSSPCFGNGLFSAPVEIWKKNRKLISPAFNQRILNNFVSVFAQQSVILCDILQKHVSKDMNIKHFVEKFSFDVVCETSMGIRINEQEKDTDFGEWVSSLLNIIYQRMFQIWYHPDIIFYNSPIGRRFTKYNDSFLAFTEKVIVEKKAEYAKQRELAKQFPEAATEDTKQMKSFLNLLLELNEDGEVFSNTQLRDEVNTFLVAGADTTATVLGFCCIMLGLNQQCQQKVHEEVLDILGPDRLIEDSDLPNLKYLERFINETCRLFPIGPLIVKAHDGDIQIDDDILPAGSSSVILIINVHRSEKYWPNPLKFDPDRFLPEEVAKRHSYAFVPFTAGPRVCIGKKYGMMLLKSSIAHLIRKFKFYTPYKSVEEIRLRQDLLLQPVLGHNIRLELREQ